MKENRVNLTKEESNTMELNKKKIFAFAFLKTITGFTLILLIAYVLERLTTYGYINFEHVIMAMLGLPFFGFVILFIMAVYEVDLEDAEKQLHSKENVDTSEVDTKTGKEI